MSRPRWEVSAGAAVLFALAYFFDGTGLVSAALPAIAVHELGHALALGLLHRRITRIRVGLFGMEMEYAGVLGERQLLLAAALGPAAGLIYGGLCRCLPQPFWRMSGAVSLALTAFNLLPILPLDGGRIAAALTDVRFARGASIAGALVLVLGGFGLFAGFRSFTLLVMGLRLLLHNCR